VTATPDPAAGTKETSMPDQIPDEQELADPLVFTQQLLELADAMGMREESAALRADLSQHDCALRVLRICQLAGLPISTDGGPGIALRPVHDMDPAEQAFLGTGVTVIWRVSRELDQASDEVAPGNAADHLETAIHHGMQAMLTTVLQEGGCHTVLDSLRGDLVVRLVSRPEQTDPLYLVAEPADATTVGKAQ
jgi:hypothetical protein